MSLKQPHGPGTPTDSGSLVVQKTSQAEMLFSLGQSDQAISLLKATIKDLPEDVQVRLKLKDIYLRCDMPSEAAEQYLHIARIYNERGETERAKDYIVRAKRLNSSSGSLPDAPQAANLPVTRKAEPAPGVALREEVAPGAGPTLSSATGEGAGRDNSSGEAARAASSPRAPVRGVESLPLTIQPVIVEAKTREVVAQAPAGPISVATRQEVTLAAQPARAESNGEALASQAGLFSSSTIKPPRITRRSAIIVGATCVALLTAAALLGMRAYDAHLDREYEALVAAMVHPEQPQPPPPDTLEEELSAEQDEGFSMTVPLPPAADQPPSEERLRTNDRPQEVKEIERPAAPVVIQPPTDGNRRTQTPPAISPISPEYERHIHRDSAGPAINLPESGALPEPPAPNQGPRKSGGVISGRILRRVEPEYPAVAKQARISGSVVVEVSVDELGNVTSARAQSGPHPLRATSVAAAMRWKFQPSTLNGAPVRSITRIIFNFK